MHRGARCDDQFAGQIRDTQSILDTHSTPYDDLDDLHTCHATRTTRRLAPAPRRYGSKREPEPDPAQYGSWTARPSMRTASDYAGIKGAQHSARHPGTRFNGHRICRRQYSLDKYNMRRQGRRRRSRARRTNIGDGEDRRQHRHRRRDVRGGAGRAGHGTNGSNTEKAEDGDAGRAPGSAGSVQQKQQ